MQRIHIQKYITVSALFVLALFLALANAAPALALFGDGFQEVEAVDGVVSIDVDEVNDGDIHYYTYTAEGREIRFFVIQSSDGVIRAAFDACDVCYESRKGYSADGEFVICNNCGRRFHSSRINVVEGGCNPAPLNRVTEDGQLRIQVSDILQGARFF